MTCKWITNRCKHTIKRCCAAARNMKDRPEVDMYNESIYPSDRSTTEKTETNKEKQEPIAEGDVTDSMINNNEDLKVKNNVTSD